MTFLEIVQQFCKEAGIAGTGPTTVTDQEGDYGRAVQWVKDADFNILVMFTNWRFMWQEFSKNTVASQQDYDASTDWSLSLRSWTTDQMTSYLQSDGEAEEYELTMQAFPVFRAKYMVGTHDADKPTVVTILPNNKLRFYPTPDDTYVIQGSYWKSPARMSDDTDTPMYPEEFHLLPLYRALLDFFRHEEAPRQRLEWQTQYDELLYWMKKEQLARSYSTIQMNPLVR